MLMMTSGNILSMGLLPHAYFLAIILYFSSKARSLRAATNSALFHYVKNNISLPQVL